MGSRPTWYLSALAGIWRLLYIKPSFPILGKLIYQFRVNGTTPETQNISYLPINAVVMAEKSPLPVIILERIIRNSEHRVITHRCTCRDARQCKNYDLHIGCMHIGLPTSEEDTTVARHVSIEEAIAHLHKAVNAGLIPFAGHVAADNAIWNVSPNRPFLTVCFCCPCCCAQLDYYRYLPPAAKDTIHRLKGVVVSVNMNKCIGCGTCTEVCWTGAAILQDGKSRIDDDVCKGCGICAQSCPQKAMSVRVDDIEAAMNELVGRIDQEVGGLKINGN